jgi:hypothetical protein
MHVVIDVPDRVYKAIKNSTKPLLYLEHLVKEGTPLPKGHGRLIDESKITKCYMLPINQIDVRELRTDAPTIIKAEREDAE